MHMSPESFKCLLNVVGPMMTKRQGFVKPSHQQNDFALRHIILLMVAANNL